MLGPLARARARLAFAVVVTAVGGSVGLGSHPGSEVSAAPPDALPFIGPVVVSSPAAVRPLLPPGVRLRAPVRAPQLVAVPAAVAGPRSPARPVAGPAGLVGPGSTPAQVRVVQRLLNARGAGLAVDGSWGPATRRAVEQLQARAGLPVDGRVDAATRALLDRR